MPKSGRNIKFIIYISEYSTEFGENTISISPQWIPTEIDGRKSTAKSREAISLFGDKSDSNELIPIK